MHLHSEDHSHKVKRLGLTRTATLIRLSCTVSFILSTLGTSTVLKMCNIFYIKTCLKRPLKHRQTKVLKTNDSLMKVESIAECSLGY